MTLHGRPLGKMLSAVLRRYYCDIDHPYKIRLWSWMRRHQGYRRFTVRYRESAWLTVDERCFIQRNVFVSGSYEPEVIEALLSCAIDREVVWDVGANIGSFAVAARLDPRVERVVCVEPDPENRAILEMNLSLNRGAAYHICPDALSDHAEKRALWQGPASNRGMSTLVAQEDESSSYVVECETLDDLVFRENLPAPSLIKMDLEGWEHPALLGAQRLLRRAPPRAIVFESRCRQDGQMENRLIPELLGDYGYQIAKISRPAASVGPQENFLALRPTR